MSSIFIVACSMQGERYCSPLFICRTHAADAMVSQSQGYGVSSTVRRRSWRAHLGRVDVALLHVARHARKRALLLWEAVHADVPRDAPACAWYSVIRSGC